MQEPVMDFDSFTALLTARWSCRAFRPDPLPKDQIARLLTAAQRVPSWCNAQPWQVEVTDAKETERLRAALYAHAAQTAPHPDLPWPAAYTGAHQDRRRECGRQLYESVGITREDKAGAQAQMLENFRFFGAPHVAILSAPRELGPYAYLDCGGFVTGFTLAAAALGLGSIPQAAIAAHAPFLRDWFQISEDRMILCAISFGHPDRTAPINHFRTSRADLTDWVRWHEATEEE